MKIQEVRIAGVRGIRSEIRLTLGGRSLLLHGDNGTGKSSVERALRWALLGEEEPTAEDPYSSESSFRRHVLTNATEPFVHVTFSDGSSIEVRPGQCKADTVGVEVRGACSRGLPFLRRTELLQVLSSRPVDRFKYFEGFLGLDQVDILLKELSDAKTALDRRASSLKTKLENELASLEPLLPTADQKLANSIESLERVALAWASRLDVTRSGALWDEATVTLAQAAGASDDDLDQKRGALTALGAELRQLGVSWDSTTIGYPEVTSDRIETLGAHSPADHLELLRHAQQHFESTESDTCPVCKQPIDWLKTRVQLKERIEGLAEYGELVEERATAARIWWSRWTDLFRLQGRAVGEIGEAASWKRLPNLPGLGLLQQPKTATQESLRFQAVMAVGGKQLEVFLRAAREYLEATTERALLALPRAEQLPEIKLCASLFARIAQKRPGLKLIQSELTAVRSECGLQTVIYEAIRKARQDVARATLDKVAKRVADFYCH